MIIKTLTLILISLVLTGIFVSESSARIDFGACVVTWLFEEGKGETTEDFSGNGNDGMLMNGPVWVEGKFGMALEFDGVDDCVEVTPFTELQGSELSITLWGKSLSTPKDYANFINLADQIGAGRLNAVVLQHRGIDAGDPFAFWADDGAGTLIRASYPEPELDEWYHFGIVQDGSNLRVYVNGNEIDESPVPVNGVNSLSTAALRIGANTVGNATTFHNCIIDEVAIFGVALDQNDIKRIMTDGLSAAVIAVSPEGKLATVWGSIKK